MVECGIAWSRCVQGWGVQDWDVQVHIAVNTQHFWESKGE